MEIKRQLIGRCLCHEVVSIFKILNLVELRLHKVVNCFDVGLHAMRPRIDGVVALSWQQFHRSSVGRGCFGVPGADVFASVIGLPYGVLGKGVEFLQEVIDVDGEELGVGEGDAFGKAEEEDAA